MTDLIYEQPLNEKIRSYLRIENLALQLQLHAEQDHQHQCFNPLFSLAELTERCDYRTDILKDIEKQIQLISHWRAHSNVDKAQVDQLTQRLVALKSPLQSQERIGCSLKRDKFISALRQRFNMTGAYCNFDFPQLHFWLGKDWQYRQQDIRNWLMQYQPLLDPIMLLLELIRTTANFSLRQAQVGFYQGDSSQALSLIRVKINSNQNCYPTISGNRNRHAIHFVDFDLHRHTGETVEFSLATCT
ncbi:cell division protein ZapD [Shewanella livingstonensis]|uniref:Cell division protein ZapD n=1 Tax=Shewanella livingstonensis TaxID=150120 RepID=A0A3G8LQJ2_9GAMM|nr:cell division protein ZapD [Shewanella livingstonensis]AZG71799.1 cell division protein ZapD [Shewanella livingstonensis]